MKKMFSKLSLLTLLTTVSTIALSADDGQAVAQVNYMTSFGNALINLLLVLLFFGSLIIIFGAEFMFFKDYVMAKDDREKKFSVPQLFAGMIVASILAAPTGFFVISNDLIAGQAGNDVEVDTLFDAREEDAGTTGG